MFCLKKGITIVFISIVAVLVIAFTSIMINHHNVKSNVLEHNPAIIRVESVNALGGWGEWFSEYSLVVVIDSEKFRLWTNGDGEITDKMSYE